MAIAFLIAAYVLALHISIWRGKEESRNLWLVITAAAFSIWSVFTGNLIPLDGVTLAACAFGGWVVLSMLWTDSPKSALEVMTWVSYLVMFLASRTIPIDVTAALLFIVPAYLSVINLWMRFIRRKPNGSAIGNTNHDGSVFLIGVYAGLWVTFNVSWFAFPLVLCVAVSLVLSRCRGAIMGLFCSLPIFRPELFVWLGIAAILAISIRQHHGKLTAIRYSSIIKRLVYNISAFLMVIESPVYGWGMDMYRKLLPEYAAKVNGHNMMKIPIAQIGGISQSSTHRVHNDHLELLVELGVVGYVLFLNIFYVANPSGMALVMLVGFFVTALFFFPFREVPLALPFWALLGSFLPVSPISVAVPVPIVILVIGLCVFAARLSYKTFMGQYYFGKAEIEGTEAKDEMHDKALSYDPYNCHYLSSAFNSNFRTAPEKAFEYAIRAIERYDGNMVKWGAWRALALAITSRHRIKNGKWAAGEAIRLNPGDTEARRYIKELDEALARGRT